MLFEDRRASHLPHRREGLSHGRSGKGRDGSGETGRSLTSGFGLHPAGVGREGGARGLSCAGGKLILERELRQEGGAWRGEEDRSHRVDGWDGGNLKSEIEYY